MLNYLALNMLFQPTFVRLPPRRHITGCATEDLKMGPFKPAYAGITSGFAANQCPLLRRCSNSAMAATTSSTLGIGPKTMPDMAS